MLVETALAAAAALVAGIALGRTRLRSAIHDSVAGTERDATVAAGESRFEQLLRSLTVGIVTIDARGRIESLNAAAATIFEIGARPIAGRAIIEVVPSFDLDRRVREALGGRAARGRISLGAPGATRILTVATLPLEGSSGAFIIATDETRLHELEQMRRDFVSNVSHELRTPLSSINLMIETILANSGDAEALNLFLPRIKEEVDRMVQLVQDLLDLARVESGRLRLRLEAVDLANVAHRIVETFEPRASLLGVRLEQRGERTPMDGDPDRLAQVLVNLIDNALRHTPAGGHVEIVTNRSEEVASLVVRDTGEGIPFADLPHIFERFYVVDRSRARDLSGTGLGLSIVKHVVEAHGGTIEAESELGRGATFTCVFPASSRNETQSSAA